MVGLRSKRTIAGLVAVAALAASGGVAYAEMQGRTSQRTDGRQAFLDDVASELGVQPADLRQAFETVALDRLDAAVAAGGLTQEQADRIRARIESGQGPTGRHHFGPFATGAHVASDYLGLEPYEVLAELRSGKSLAKIAEENGRTADGLEQAIVDAAKSRLDTAVQNGRLAQSEADQLLAGLKEVVPVVINHTPAARPVPAT